MGCGASKAEPEPTPPPAAAMRQRRGSAAAQGGIDPTKLNLATLPKVAKEPDALARIEKCLANNVLCNHLSREYKDAVVASMKEVTVQKDETIIKQGDLGDFWYVIDSGSFDVFKTAQGETEAAKVKSYATGDSFGELALMFNQRRAASVVASADSVVWAVDQSTFQALVKSAATEHPEQY